VTTEAWVINASPIILYARIGKLDILEQLAPRLIISETVIEEVHFGNHKDDTADQAVAWATRYRYPDIAIPSSVERWDLGPGESQVISHCLQGPRCAVLDDQMARRCIGAHMLRMIGSLGVILRAKERGLIDKARPWVYKLRSQGRYVTDELIERSLSAIGESR
jgi:predicted nucleic acid-binding protein